jgi:ABC-type enterobactin transport system permease subunit
MMVVGGLIFLVLPWLWAKMNQQSLDWRIMAVGIAIAALFFVMAAQYRRERRAVSAPPPAA